MRQSSPKFAESHGEVSIGNVASFQMSNVVS